MQPPAGRYFIRGVPRALAHDVFRVLSSSVVSKPYLLDGVDEMSRLDMQAAFYDPVHDIERMRPSPRDRVLDAGCGSGAYSRAIARVVSEGSVVGVDREARYVEYATKTAHTEGIANATFRQGDACALPLDDDSFDLVWSKHLLQWVRTPHVAVREFMRVAKPGARVVCANFDGFLRETWPVVPEMQVQIDNWFDAAARELGFDCYVGRKLASMFHEAGLEDIHVVTEVDRMYGGFGKMSDVQRTNWRIQMEAAFDFSVKVLGSPDAATKYLKDLDAYLDRDDATRCTTMYYVSGQKPR
jgi:ubiquinone/menaquinone biosynthesis C-methylase UbiE